MPSSWFYKALHPNILSAHLQRKSVQCIELDIDSTGDHLDSCLLPRRYLSMPDELVYKLGLYRG